MNPESIETGQVYKMYVAYRLNNGELVDPPDGKIRPVVIFKNPLDDKIYGCQTTTKTKKPYYLKNGVLIDNLEGTGLQRESIVRLEYHSRYEIEDLSLLEGPLGALSEQDTDRFLLKFLQVLERELKRENDLEL